MILSPLPVQKFFDNNGRPLAGGLLFTYEAGTSIKVDTFTDSSGGSLNTNPIVLDFRGEANVWLDPLLTYKFVLARRGDTDPPTDPIWTVDNISALGGLTQQVIGQILWPITPAEEAAGFTVDTLSFVGPQGYIPRYKIVPNDALAATNNTIALIRLLDPLTDGPQGRIFFPAEEAVSTTWYFNDIVQVRRKIDIDLGQGTLHFSKTRATSDDYMGFLTFIGSVSIKNGGITVDYDGTGGINAGCALRIGSRYSYPYGIWTNGVFDQDDLEDNGLPLMGNITLEALTIISNNPAIVAPVVMIGGLQRVYFNDIYIDGQDAHITGIYYEFGFASTNGFPSPVDSWHWSSSHGHDMEFLNTRVENLKNDGGEGAGIALIGAYQSIVDNLYVNIANGAFEFRPGEALFFDPWLPDVTGAKRGITLRNIVGQNITTNGFVLTGAESASSGYLADHVPPLTAAQQTDLMSFSLDGFAISGAGAGIAVSGPIDARNGAIIGCINGIVIAPECVQFDFDLVRIFDSTDIGLTCSTSGAIFSPTPRNKIGQFRNGVVAGSVGAGTNWALCQSVKLTNNRFGYSMAYDGQSETTQTSGVVVDTTGFGVECDGNYVSTSGGAAAYNMIGSGDRYCNVRNGFGTYTFAGAWKRDGYALASSAQLGDSAEAINTASKYTYKFVIENSNNKLYFALGPNPTDGWRLCDGSATVTPVP